MIKRAAWRIVSREEHHPNDGKWLSCSIFVFGKKFTHPKLSDLFSLPAAESLATSVQPESVRLYT